MAPAKVERTEVDISMSGRPEHFLATGEILQFDGFFIVYGGGKDDRLLPPLKKGQKLDLEALSALETFSRPSVRYSEGTLVKKLEDLGIGRPSTYAPTISTIQERDYVEKKDVEGEAKEVQELTLSGGKIKQQTQPATIGAERSKLLPTQLAEIVTDFLMKYFSEIFDYDFTAKTEKELDEIEEGSQAWQVMLERFYKGFKPLVEKSRKASRAEAVQQRLLGKDRKSGKPVYVRFGRYGPVLQLGEAAAKKDKKAAKPQFAPLPEDATLEDVTLQQALPMFDLPRQVGKTADGQIIMANVGRYGPYIKVGKDFTSIKERDPLTITEIEARQVLAEKKKEEDNRVISEFGKIQVLRGPYGPYVTDGRINARIPKNLKPEEVDEKMAIELLEKRQARKARRATEI
jgi:DNA topoisomerase-1